MPKQDIVLKDVEIPEGFEATGEYRYARPGEWVKAINKVSAYKASEGTQIDILILRKLPQWRDPVLPADFEKRAQFSDTGKEWKDGRLFGWHGNTRFHWLSDKNVYWKFCQVCDE